MTNLKIKLIENAHIEGYKGAEYRYTTQEGKASAMVIRDNWYAAEAVDKDGNMYGVVWEIKAGWDPEKDTDEENACEWEKPSEIISYSTGKPVEAEIEW